MRKRIKHMMDLLTQNETVLDKQSKSFKLCTENHTFEWTVIDLWQHHIGSRSINCTAPSSCGCPVELLHSRSLILIRTNFKVDGMLFVTNITIVLVFNKVTLQSTHWSIQTLSISGGDSSCSWVFYSCTGPKCGVGVDLVDCNAVGGGHVATSIDQSVRISACGALALEEYKQSASVQPLLCNS